ncbi:UvrD-helicase domain-containing protein [Paracidovorax citrulli]|uniref:UvrD-helicase domain-containing protein n=1 Tax=Paracidovorax citrulli TaxID=80869 RepID=UPI003FA69EFC
MSDLTPQQQAVVDAPMAPLCVIACAGSGKTKTAVQRLARMRRILGSARGRIALLSFSNVAVETFRGAYEVLARELPAGAGRSRVEVNTLDAFIAGNVLRPYGHRPMKAQQSAYLVSGKEQFLAAFTFLATYPRPITDLRLRIRGGEESFFYEHNDTRYDVATRHALDVIDRFGKTGAYTHELGRYWAYRVLKENPEITRVLARRYPYIIIDEAQDIGSVHEAILERLISAGSCVSLIGDPNQGIYDFAGANGQFLRDYHLREGVQRYPLQRNFRSVPAIVALANGLCGRGDEPERPAPSTLHGAFFVGYKRGEIPRLLERFKSGMAAAGADHSRSAILCRNRSQVALVRGDHPPSGIGVVKQFATAALERDNQHDYLAAFRTVVIAVQALLDKPPEDLVSRLTQPGRFPGDRALRKTIWAFTRDVHTGLPDSRFVADSHWHAELVSRVKRLLTNLRAEHGLTPLEKLGNRLKKTDLPSEPLLQQEDPEIAPTGSLRVDTVHQAKGESLDAVLYLCLKEHAQQLLSGVDTEGGRVGYVAATRARDLLWIGVPTTALEQLRPLFLAKGFVEIE